MYSTGYGELHPDAAACPHRMMSRPHPQTYPIDRTTTADDAEVTSCGLILRVRLRPGAFRRSLYCVAMRCVMVIRNLYCIFQFDVKACPQDIEHIDGEQSAVVPDSAVGVLGLFSVICLCSCNI